MKARTVTLILVMTASISACDWFGDDKEEVAKASVSTTEETRVEHTMEEFPVAYAQDAAPPTDEAAELDAEPLPPVEDEKLAMSDAETAEVINEFIEDHRDGPPESTTCHAGKCGTSAQAIVCTPGKSVLYCESVDATDCLERSPSEWVECARQRGHEVDTDLTFRRPDADGDTIEFTFFVGDLNEG